MQSDFSAPQAILAIPSRVRQLFTIDLFFRNFSAADDCIQVVARFRPPNRAEIASGGESIVNFESEDTCSINVRNPFTFLDSVSREGVYSHYYMF